MKPHLPTDPSAVPSSSEQVADEQTGVPGLRSWRAVYLIVLVNFVLCVALLALFSRAFA
ncbi:MAG: hypothetical protein WC378_15735 [Opitutaceae bacterium]|jgi:hypothetical protein